jgi:opacity protein-like surface antigen
MKKLMVFTCSLLIAAGTIADQQSYWSLSAGWAQPSDGDIIESGTTAGEIEYDAGWIIEGAIGNKISDLPIAYELALSYQQNEANMKGDSTSLDVDVWTLMLNGMYFIDSSSCFTPYGLAGVGLIDYDSDDIDGDIDFAGQLGAGICYSIDPMTCLNLEYRYLFANNLEINESEVEFNTQILQLGVTYMY